MSTEPQSETEYLLSNPANAARLTESIASFEAQERRVRAEWTREIASMLRGMTKVPPEVRPGLVYAANFLDPPQVTVEVVDDTDPLDTPTESEWQITEREDQSSWPAHLRDDAPSQRCSGCGRKTWAVGQFGMQCLMTQPDGSECSGAFGEP